MGILTRQEGSDWIIEVRESWEFKKADGSFLEFHKFAELLNLNYDLVFVGEKITVTMKNEKVTCGSSQELLVRFSKLIEMKSKHGQVREEKKSDQLRKDFRKRMDESPFFGADGDKLSTTPQQRLRGL